MARTSRIRRIRTKIVGTASRPRLAVRKTNRNIFAQLVDDMSGTTLVAVSTLQLPKAKKTDQATQAGKALVAKALKRQIKKVVFDRRGSAYHGRIKAFAEAARQAGLTF